LLRATLLTALLTAHAAIALAQTAPAAGATAPPAGAKSQKAGRNTVDAIVTKTWTGDLPGMIQRRQIRVLVTYNKTGYFIDKGVQRGITYDAFRLFETDLNARRKTGNLPIHVVFLPVSRDELADALTKGRGDIVAAGITVTESRLKLADFSEPLANDVKEVVVTGPGAPAIATLDDLAGQTVHVRAPSLYQEHLTELSARMVQQGKKPIDVKPLAADLEDEDILQMTHAGLVKITIVNDFLATFWKQLLSGLTIHEDVVIKDGEQIAYAMRKDSPLLKAELDRFVKTHRRGTIMGNVLFMKYLKSTKFAKDATSAKELEKFRIMRELFKKYGDQYGIDWLLMAAQGYQESGLNQTVRSKVGAVGVMQVMPATGKDMKVGDITKMEPNINAGVKYIRFMIDQYFKDEPMDNLNKGLFAFASYNAGPARVKALRNEAAKSGLNPNLWFNNVEQIAAKRIGRETVQYVGNIYKYYIAYKLAVEEGLTGATRPPTP
jgi:membrane-bound lytic murein transglycosylase MltF